jgi:hypothetical protein
MRRLLLLASLAVAAPVALAQTPVAVPATPAAAVSSDTLAARAGRAEGFFFGGNSASLRALSDSTFSAALTDEAHQGFLLQLMGMGGATANGEWTAAEMQGMQAYRRPYTLAGMNALFVVVFNAEGKIAGLALTPAEG